MGERRDEIRAVDRAELADRLRGHVERLAGLIGPRHEGDPSSIEAARDYVARELGAAGEAVERETFASIGGREAVNLVLNRGGVRSPERVVMLGAHYDTVFTTPGADDNASAVAALTEVARMLHGMPTARTLRFVSFANEEPPHFDSDTMGSQHHARRCQQRGEQIVGMVCLEMIGYYSDQRGSQRYPPPIDRLARWLFGDRGDFLGVVSNLRSVGLLWPLRRGFRRGSKLPLVTMALPQAIGDIRLSDHGPFWDLGYRAVMVTDTSFYRNPHYHLDSDTPETLDYARLAEATVGIAGAMLRLARGRGRRRG